MNSKQSEHQASKYAGHLAMIVILCLLVGEIGGAIWEPLAAAMPVAVISVLVLIIVHLRDIIAVARGLFVAALVSVVLVLILDPEAQPALWSAARQGTIFAGFLMVLGLLRGPVRASRLIGLAGTRLFSFPTRLRPAALSFGSQFLAVLFNLGTINILSDIAGRQLGASGLDQEDTVLPAAVKVTLLAQQGTILATIWNPIGVGFSIITTSIVGLDPVGFLLLSFMTSMVLGMVTLIGPGRITSDARLVEPALGWMTGHEGSRALVTMLLAVVGMIALSLVIHYALGVSFITSACLVIPALVVLWPFVEPGLRSTGLPGSMSALSQAAKAMANESTVFLAAALLGAAISLLFEYVGLSGVIENGAVPELALILGALIAVPLGAALLVPHSISMVLIAQILGQGPVGASHPMALALALCCSWAIAIATSPVSAIGILTARHLGLSPQKLVFGINRGFTLTMVAISILSVCIVYLLD